MSAQRWWRWFDRSGSNNCCLYNYFPDGGHFSFLRVIFLFVDAGIVGWKKIPATRENGISTQIGNMFAAECNISQDKRLISIVIELFSTYASTLDPERIDMTEGQDDRRLDVSKYHFET